MEKKEQLLIVDPANELRFRGPFNKPIISTIRLINPTDQIILFKIKTTVPKKYIVRPNCGTLKPHSIVLVQVCLQPFVFDPTEKNKHKFMVQSLIEPEGNYSIDKLWKEVKPEEFMDSKLRCIFEIPPDDKVSTSENPSTEPELGSDLASVGDTVYNTEGGAGGDDERSRAVGDIKQILDGLLLKDAHQLQAQLLKMTNEVKKEQPQHLELEQQLHQQHSSTIGTTPLIGGPSGNVPSGVPGAGNVILPPYQNQYLPPQQGFDLQRVPKIYIVLAIAAVVIAFILGLVKDNF